MGYSLTAEEFHHYLPELQPINPKVGKFWTGKNVEPGIYIIITGKVRLLDDNDELITTLEPGESFGEFTLFTESEFQPYAARASANLQLCFLPERLLLPLIAKYPEIREHLWEKAYSPKTQIIQADYTPIKPNRPENDNSNSDSTPYSTSQSKINKAYFPSPRQQVGHLWQRVTGRYPFFAQQSSSDCGVACLVMVSRY